MPPNVIAVVISPIRVVSFLFNKNFINIPPPQNKFSGKLCSGPPYTAKWLIHTPALRASRILPHKIILPLVETNGNTIAKKFFCPILEQSRHRICPYISFLFFPPILYHNVYFMSRCSTCKVHKNFAIAKKIVPHQKTPFRALQNNDVTERYAKLSQNLYNGFSCPK